MARSGRGAGRGGRAGRGEVKEPAAAAGARRPPGFDWPSFPPSATSVSPPPGLRGPPRPRRRGPRRPAVRKPKMYALIALPALLTLAAPPSSPAPSLPDPDPAEAWVERTLAGLSLREKVAQMVMPWIAGGALSGAEARRARALVAEQRVGGLLIGLG